MKNAAGPLFHRRTNDLSKKLTLQPLDAAYLDAAVELAQAEYDRERIAVPALPAQDLRPFYRTQLASLFTDGLGALALEDGRLAGFLAFCAPFDTGNGDERGAAAPLYGYAADGEARGVTLGRLFTFAADILCRNYAENLRVSIYAHDRDALEVFLMSSFAMDTTDVVRPADTPVPAQAQTGLTFRELTKPELLHYREDLIALYRALINHLRQSPVFYHCRDFLPIEDRFEDFLSDDMRIFSVFDGEHLVGMIDAEPTDIDFAASDAAARGLGDVFLAPAYRGRGIGPALLQFACASLARDGFRSLFVTHGTINPTARGFWDKYFTNYAFTMTRLIDRSMLGVIPLI